MFAELKIGEVARRSGVSIRTLHHYHELGLLVPSHHSAGEHRLYSRRDLERLLQIRGLQRLGFSLDEIRVCLEDPAFRPLPAIEGQLEHVRRRLAATRELAERLEAIANDLRHAEEPSATDLLEAIQKMSAIEDHYTPEQREQLKARAKALGPEGMEQGQAAWASLLDDYRAAREAGHAPDSEEALALAGRSRELIAAFTGGDAGIERSLGEMYASKPDLPQQFGMEPALWEYMGRARAALEALDADD